MGFVPFARFGTGYSLSPQATDSYRTHLIKESDFAFLALKNSITFVFMSEYKVRVNSNEYKLSLDNGKVLMDGKPFDADILEFKKGHFQVLRNNRSFRAEIVEHLPEEKSLRIKVNN